MRFAKSVLVWKLSLKKLSNSSKLSSASNGRNTASDSLSELYWLIIAGKKLIPLSERTLQRTFVVGSAVCINLIECSSLMWNIFRLLFLPYQSRINGHETTFRDPYWQLYTNLRAKSIAYSKLYVAPRWHWCLCWTAQKYSCAMTPPFLPLTPCTHVFKDRDFLRS